MRKEVPAEATANTGYFRVVFYILRIQVCFFLESFFMQMSFWGAQKHEEVFSSTASVAYTQIQQKGYFHCHMATTGAA